MGGVVRARILVGSIGIAVMTVAAAVAAGGSGSSIGAGTVFLPNPVADLQKGTKVLIGTLVDIATGPKMVEPFK